MNTGEVIPKRDSWEDEVYGSSSAERLLIHPKMGTSLFIK